MKRTKKALKVCKYCGKNLLERTGINDIVAINVTECIGRCSAEILETGKKIRYVGGVKELRAVLAVRGLINLYLLRVGKQKRRKYDIVTR